MTKCKHRYKLIRTYTNYPKKLKVKFFKCDKCGDEYTEEEDI